MFMTILGDFFRRVGEGLGLFQEEVPKRPARSGADIRDAKLALEELRRFQLEMRKKGVTRAEVRRWINEDRRA